jgi:hypothetical protein
MRARLVPLLAVAAATAAVSVPANAAAILTHCATRLVHAPAGTSASCQTQGPAPLGNCCVGVYRTVTIDVAEGVVDAYLACDGAAAQHKQVSGVEPATIERWGGYNCTVTLVAAVPQTSAVATSRYEYVYYGVQN